MGTQAQGSLELALAHAERLASARPELALEQVDAILEVAPGHPQALLARGIALRAVGRVAEARDTLAALALSEPRHAGTRLELARAHRALGDARGAIAALEAAVRLRPDLAEAWTELAQARRLEDDEAGALIADRAAIKAGARDPELLAAALALNDDRLDEAERALRDRLRRRPEDAAALRMLAETRARRGAHDEAETLLRRALAAAPGFDAARETLARVLQRLGRSEDALAEADRLAARDPANPSYAMLRAASLVRLGDYDAAITLYEGVLARHPRQPKGWMSLGHALKTVGRRDDAVTAYRTAIAQAPTLGEAWWSLANLKTAPFTDADLAAMETALAAPALADDDCLHLRFALGRAREDRADHAAAWDQYAAGNAIRRAQLPYQAEHTTTAIDRSIALFTPAFLRARAGQGCPDPDPIFIVGLPRSGSTLVEQILASHPLVEGTMELPDLLAIAGRLGEGGAYHAALAALSPDDRAQLGREYLDRTRAQRRTDRPFFTDKMPNNWMHVGLIRLILPNARIIDARRDAVATCFSAFKQHFARGQGFSYNLAELGCYYRDYLRLMAHFDAAAPGAVVRVEHEALVADPDTRIRALLTALALPFNAACLTPHQTHRAVRTASSEQVRRPITAEGLHQHLPYLPWLGPLIAALATDQPTDHSMGDQCPT